MGSKHEVGSGGFDPSILDPEHCSPTNTTAWELSLLHRHYHKPTASVSLHVANQCPTSGEFSLTQDMKVGSDELFTNFSMDEMAFNPSIKPGQDQGEGQAVHALHHVDQPRGHQVRREP